MVIVVVGQCGSDGGPESTEDHPQRPKPSARTARRRQATFHHALAYAVELDLFVVNPLDRIRGRPGPPATAFDPPVVVKQAPVKPVLADSYRLT